MGTHGYMHSYAQFKKNQIKNILSSKPHQYEWKAEENGRKWIVAIALQNFYNLMRKSDYSNGKETTNHDIIKSL